ncbi:L-serine dehydratase 2 [Acaryochloris thomasi RCC1774]|uniref:L-serine dehydratase n=1 Tax=Acaryochloris thomasi RCC1774 TaxID=1764569 RepID=A0A2W1JJD8_9CYAN|nr:L-serine ammonia-lyase [Acaryochloris thomasi]PZD71615.1 L-serine dehydratase 2 [Acaryochloris thomasi RCC1774]
MFISVLDLFKIGVGPSSSHTIGPMVAAHRFREQMQAWLSTLPEREAAHVRCTLKGSLSFTGKGHGTDRAIVLGLHGFTPRSLTERNVTDLAHSLWQKSHINFADGSGLSFSPSEDIDFSRGQPLPEHPNGMIFEVLSSTGSVLLHETYFSIGGGFIHTKAEISQLVAPVKAESAATCPFPFDSARSMLTMAHDSGLSIAAMKQRNEHVHHPEDQLQEGLDSIWQAMQVCIQKGLAAQGTLPGGLGISRRAKTLVEQLHTCPEASLNDWLCAYAMAVNEENAAGHMVVTAPTNGAAGVIPAVLYYFVSHEGGTSEQVHEFLLTAAAIGGIIKHRSSISGAEVGCQGEVGSAAAMAAAGLCAVRGCSPSQVENAAEIALEHHLGMTCDPVGGLVQVPCIERNGFGAIKAYTAASLAKRGTGEHFMPLDNCIAAMKHTGLEMSEKFKETALGGLAVSITEC